MTKVELIELPPERVLRQFTLTDKVLLHQDALFWLTTLDTYLQLYKHSSVETETGRENKALICARLAGLGMAIAAHFGTGVESLADLNDPVMEDAGVDTYNRLTPHTDRMEAAAKKGLS